MPTLNFYQIHSAVCYSHFRLKRTVSPQQIFHCLVRIKLFEFSHVFSLPCFELKIASAVQSLSLCFFKVCQFSSMPELYAMWLENLNCYIYVNKFLEYVCAETKKFFRGFIACNNCNKGKIKINSIIMTALDI